MPSELFAFTVPFRDLAPAVDDWRERTCASKPSHGVPPHVTLLIPAPPDPDGAATALASFEAFDVTFALLKSFPGTLWLAPEPSEPFVGMTRALMERFPERAPYDGLFDGITPHLTVAQGEDLAAPEAAVEPLLPLRSHASSVVLFEQVSSDRLRENAELAL
jgi:2'-5' RNA ligase superfamily